MSYCGLICEYNPFHSGHLYQLKKIRELANIDAIILAMSGNFVQRAEPAIIDKYTRAEIATLHGADAVIQIPTAYTVSGGEKFSEAALSILSSIKGLKYLAFGCETARFELLEMLASIRAREDDKFKDSLRSFLKRGLSYPNALCEASLSLIDKEASLFDECRQIMSRPNNILAIEYLKSIYKHGYDIKPIFIKREDNYDSNTLSGAFSSATAIREGVFRNDLDSIKEFLPYDPSLLTRKPVNRELFDSLLLFSIREKGVEGLSQLSDCAEGIENKLYKNSIKYASILDVLSNTKSKRYTLSRLKRICVQALLGITKELSTAPEHSYGRLLSIKKQFKKHLSLFGNVIIQKSDLDSMNLPSLLGLIEVDVFCDDVYSLLTSSPAGNFFKGKLLEL